MYLITKLKILKKYLLKYHFYFFKTIIANFRLFSFKEAIHLPLVIYNPTQLKLSRSHIQLNTKPKFGLIKFGYNEDFFLPTKCHSMLFMINGKMIINGKVRFSPGSILRISGGSVIMGKRVNIGCGCKILANNKILIGSCVDIAYETIICDTNYHYMRTCNVVPQKSGKVVIGNNVWIANNCLIVKGTVIPNNVIVSNKSLVNKDFSQYTNGVILAGSPAKIIRTDCYRIFSKKEETELDEFFLKNETANSLKLDTFSDDFSE